MNQSNFYLQLLNDSNLRTKLGRLIPPIRRLESLDELSDLRLIDLKVDEHNCLIIKYEAKAKPGRYLNLNPKLVKIGVLEEGLSHGLGQEYDYDGLIKHNHGKTDEHKSSTSFIHNGRITVRLYLTIYNPNYKFR